MLAFRAARAFTGRSKIGVFAGGYHGSHDYAASIPADVVHAPGGPGIPDAVAETLVVSPFDDVDGTPRGARAALGRSGCGDRRAGARLGRRHARLERVPRVPSRAHARRRSAARLRRDHLLPHRLPRRPGSLRDHARPDDVGKIIGGGLPGGRPRRPRRRDGAVRPAARRSHRPRRDVQCEPADDGGGAGDARRADARPLRRARSTCAASSKRASTRRPRRRPRRSARCSGSSLPTRQAYPSCTSDLLANGILMTPRGMGCLSTPMSEAEMDAFVEAVRLSL